LTYTPGKASPPQVVTVNRPGAPAPVVLTNPGRVTTPQVVVVNHGSAFPPANHFDFSQHFAPPHDLHVVADIHNHPHYFYGPNHEEFHFVRSYPGPFYIQSRESLRDLLLRPLANSVAWGIGQIVTAELADALDLPLYTSLYALSPNVVVVPALPAGYVIGEAIPANVALVTAGPSGEVVVCNRVTTGAYVAYRTTSTGLIINEVVVLPPPSTSTTATVASIPAPAAPAPETPDSTASPAIPVSPKIGKVVYDADKNPVGVIVLSNDGSQEFVPLLAQNDAPKSP
jgi:hypothetical protein